MNLFLGIFVALMICTILYMVLRGHRYSQELFGACDATVPYTQKLPNCNSDSKCNHTFVCAQRKEPHRHRERKCYWINQTTPFQQELSKLREQQYNQPFTSVENLP